MESSNSGPWSIVRNNSGQPPHVGGAGRETQTSALWPHAARQAATGCVCYRSRPDRAEEFRVRRALYSSRRRSMVAVSLVAAVTVAACGGGSGKKKSASSTGTTTTTPTGATTAAGGRAASGAPAPPEGGPQADKGPR